jgi:hypothetical protein
MATAQQHLADIDVHKKMLAVVVRREREGQLEYEKRKFSATRKEIHHLAAWLQQEQVGEVNRPPSIGGRCGTGWRHISVCT